MRIITGKYKGRQLETPEDESITRPITDRVKESLFNKLFSMGALDGGNVIDAFAGTGTLGLEALSRGMAHCTFIERHRKIGELLSGNIESLGLTLGSDAHVLHSDALTAGWMNLLPKRPVSLIFLDPPYPLAQDPTTLAALMRLIETLMATDGVCTPDCILHLRTPKAIEPPPAKGWGGPVREVYGTQALNFYGPE